VVNIAGFQMYVFEGREVVWESRIMVGKTYRKTPVFRGDMEYLVINPTWTVPPGILARDTLPAIKNDPGYLKRKNMRVLKFDGTEVDPTTIDWPSMKAQGFPYMLRQGPGPANALGRVKFIFPNSHYVFLHDTPSKGLFDQSERAFSSGCIRVENPFDLAEILLGDQPNQSRADIDAAVKSGDTKTVRLSQDQSILIIYLTAFAEPDGTVHFYNDIYERDAAVLEELDGDVVMDVAGVEFLGSE
jgi:murein L,D-transpeptidase YcbB/YkuD